MEKKIVGYLRVSTDAQTEKFGLDMQKTAIEAKANSLGVEINDWYVDDGYSGSTLNRPAIKRLLTAVEHGEIVMIFVYKLDRLSRDTVDTLTLMNNVFPKHGVTVVSTQETFRNENPMDEVVLGFSAMMGQYERKVITGRMRAGMKERIKNGYWRGSRPPHGYVYDRNDGILHIVPDEARNVIQCYEMYLNGFSCQTINDVIGLRNHSLVHHILSNKTYLGLQVYRGEVYQARHEPIVPQELYDAVQAERKRRYRGAFPQSNNMLTGLCWCGKCGSRMRYQAWGKGKPKRLACYAHFESGQAYMKNTDVKCPNIVVCTDVENEVSRCFSEFAISVGENRNRGNETQIDFDAEIKKLDNEIQRLYDVFSMDDEPDENLTKVIQQKKNRKKKLLSEKETADKKKVESAQQDISAQEISRIADVWDKLSPSERNDILRKAVEKIVVDGDDIIIRFNLL